MKNVKQFLGLLFFSSLLFSCSEQNIEEQPQNQLKTRTVATEEGLKDVADFPVGNVWAGGHPTWGTNIGTDLGGPRDDYSTSAYGDLSTVNHKQLNVALENSILVKEFSSITPEMALKMHNISVSPDSIDFREADAMMEFAEANNLRVHGHVFLFDKSVPKWALDYEKNNTWTKAEWRAWITKYVTRVTTRYAGRIASWDVVNEIIDNMGKVKKDFFWLKVAGDDIVEYTFKLVESIDPQAKLFVNDNFQEMFPTKSKGVVKYANYLKTKGCKVDGVGYQNHIILAGTQGGYLSNKIAYKDAVDAGYLVHVSELDISVNLLGGTLKQTDYQHRSQRKSYNDIARAYRDAVPSDKRWGITIWNVADHNSYLNLLYVFQKIRIWKEARNYPLLYDKDYIKKPAYDGFKKGVQGEWISWFAPLNYTSINTRSTGRENYISSVKENVDVYSSFLSNIMDVEEADARGYVEDYVRCLDETK